MSDTQGKGPYRDESRVERNTSRPAENPSTRGGARSTTGDSQVDRIRADTKEKAKDLFKQ